MPPCPLTLKVGLEFVAAALGNDVPHHEHVVGAEGVQANGGAVRGKGKEGGGTSRQVLQIARREGGGFRVGCKG